MPNIRSLQPKLIPLCLNTPSTRRRLREHREALAAAEVPYWEGFRRAVAVRRNRERPFRAMAQRRRLDACHWALDPNPFDCKGRWKRPPGEWGRQGPKWLGGCRRPASRVREEAPLCNECHGSAEGMHEGTTCRTCRGSGLEK